MTAILVDTSILVRLANANDVQHSDAIRSVLELHRQGDSLCVTPQVMVEFRNVATRPRSANGAGLSIADADAHAATFEARFSLLEENAKIFVAWKTIVNSLAIVGKQVHDARLVAVCHVHAVTQLLTFNVNHFLRMAALPPAIVVLDPAKI